MADRIRRTTNAQRAEMLELRAKGWTYQQISEHLGFSMMTVQYHLDPILRKRHNRNMRYRTAGRDPESPRQ